MTRTILTRLPRRAAALGVGLSVALSVSAVASSPAWADTSIARSEAYGTSDGLDLYVQADLMRDSSNQIYAFGYDIEEHDYERAFTVVVTLQQLDAAGDWVVVAQDAETDYEGAQASTAAYPAGATYRACAAASVDDGAVITTCTA
jgi:hypothetical protein